MVSIVMPTYNAVKYIQGAVESVLRQTYTDWELLIVDDGSTDGTEQMIQNLIKMDERVKLVKNRENIGVAETRNRGVELAKGEWIAFLDSDDIWHPNKLQEQLELYQRNGMPFIFTGSGFMDESGKLLNYELSVPQIIGYRELLKQNVISCSSVLIKKELAKKYPMEHSEKMHEDFAVWLSILKQEHIKAAGVNKPLLIYRISEKSKSGNKWKASVMTFRVYRYIGLSIIPAVYYWLCYVCRSVKKYHNL